MRQIYNILDDSYIDMTPNRYKISSFSRRFRIFCDQFDSAQIQDILAGHCISILYIE